jgi:hypothetical protein
VLPPAASRYGILAMPARPRRGESPPRGQCALVEKTYQELAGLHAICKNLLGRNLGSRGLQESGTVVEKKGQNENWER